MHTYTPTASHDPVVEFDNGDIGNQTNLNNAIRALGNRTELAKITNDSQTSAISTIQTQLALAYNPATLTASVTCSADAPGGSFSGGEEVFAFSGAVVTGNDVASGLSTQTYTGTGGGTKILRLGPNSRYLLKLNILLNAWLTGPGSTGTPPDGTEIGVIDVVQATNTALSTGVVTQSVKSHPILPNPILVSAPYSQIGWRFDQELHLLNNTASPQYVGLKWALLMAPAVSQSHGATVLVRRIGVA